MPTINPTTETQTPENLVRSMLDQAKQAGVTQAEATFRNEAGFSVTVRKGAVETLEHHRAKGLSLTVYFGHCSGSAVTSDLTPSALRTTLEKACSIARFTGNDPCSGLADAELMAYNYPDLDLFHEWNITPEQGIEIATECESLARGYDKRITNSEGATVNTFAHKEIYGNSHGFLGVSNTTYHSVSCALIAQHGHDMQSDSDYTCARDPEDLLPISTVAKNAAERTVKRLDARRLSTRSAPVIFRADVARGLLSHFLGAISGSNLYRKSSFLVDQLGKQVFPTQVSIVERPHLLKALGSAAFDDEGVATCEREIVKEGLLQGYLLGSYSARKLGMKTTGNAGGAHNVFINTCDQDLAGLLKEMQTGLLVTDLMGQGVHMVTGDYSRGAFGYWVENGEIQYPVQEITIAGNLKDMFSKLVAVGHDIDNRGNIHTGSIWIDSMMIAGE
ncbi:MAG TPA: metalloprotease PmbA [Gammaproteobacteria bacterium]|nr:metalloprotease PmbA [Gammaproteobacteria bacterium]